MTVRTRFAPSPTGSLHVGGARTALYCLVHARANRGEYLLRIEDTDQVRSTDEATLGILRDLAWLGISHTEGPGRPDTRGVGPFLQSQRLELYNQYIEQLLASGKAYEAWDSKAELDAMRLEAEKTKSTLRYRRRSPWSDEQIAAFKAEGRKPVVRLRCPDHDIEVDDDILGKVIMPADDHDDIVIRKADGFPTYHFAVVIDDVLMGVSQVLRGQEHLMNTPKHIGIYEAFGWTPPRYGHFPLICNPSGSKMSKRDKAKIARESAKTAAKQRGANDYAWLAEAAGLAVDEITAFVDKKNDSVSTAEAIARVLNVPLPMIEVMDFRKGGYLPEALKNYLALLGWSPGHDLEIFTVDEMVAAWDIGRVGKTAGKFDAKKLEWMNGEYIRRSDIAHLEAAFDAWFEVVPSPLARIDRGLLRRLITMYQQRMTTLVDLQVQTRFFFTAPASYDPAAVKKHVGSEGAARLREIHAGLTAMETWTSAALQAAIETIAGEHLGKFAQPIRVALTGTAVSPPIFDVLEILGRDESLARIARAAEALG
jgi:glutamyl/glutaminyl-tRNA synthetase